MSKYCEYPPMHGMIDNRMVKENHQQGIERVTQRKREHYPDDVIGHNGKMGKNHPSLSHWSRRGDSLTPRKA